jgi:hypothetical protein
MDGMDWMGTGPGLDMEKAWQTHVLPVSFVLRKSDLCLCGRLALNASTFTIVYSM